MWTTDGRVDPSKSTGDINSANEFIKITNIKEEDIIKRFESGQLKATFYLGYGI
ncbi:MAG: hypothetical protein Q8N79_00100 [Candidatus Methanoperedens sp.]|nr:hypothetical protein [Candidatus Methanoperedens sp.]